MINIGKYRFDGKRVIHYLLIYLLLVVDGSFLFVNYTTPICVLVLVLFLVLCFMNKKYCNKSVVYFLVFLFLSVILVRIFNGGIGIDAWLLWTAEITSVYIAYSFDTKKFIERYVRTVVFLAIISLLGTLIATLNPDILRNILSVRMAKGYNDTPFYGMILYIFRDTYEGMDTRNVGIYTEPGRYQLILNVSILICLYYRKNLAFSQKKLFFNLGVLIITLITTGSTTGFIGLGIIIIGYFVFQSNSIDKRRIIRIFIGVIIALMVEYSMNLETSFLNVHVIDKLKDTVSSTEVSSGGARILASRAMLHMIGENPFGTGYTAIEEYIASNPVYRKNAAGGGLLRFIAAVGIVPALVSMLWMFGKLFLVKRNYMKGIVIVGLFVNMAMAQAYFFYPSLIIFTFIDRQRITGSTKAGLKLEESRIKIQNTSIVQIIK